MYQIFNVNALKMTIFWEGELFLRERMRDLIFSYKIFIRAKDTLGNSDQMPS